MWKPSGIVSRILQIGRLRVDGGAQLCSLHCQRSSLSLPASTQAQALTDSTPQPRDFHGMMRMIKTSPMKLNLVAKLIRRMPIAQALAQVEFCEKKVAHHIKMVLTDTQRRAVKVDKVHPLNLWVAESFVGKGQYKKHIRYHGKGMSGLGHKMYAHYFLTLREGKPPKKVRSIENHKSRKTKKLILAGPKSVPNSL